MQLLGESPVSVPILLWVHVGVVAYVMILLRRPHIVGVTIFLRLIVTPTSLDLLLWWRCQGIFLLLRVHPKKITCVGGMKFGLASVL
jgi:hypothetical protein